MPVATRKQMDTKQARIRQVVMNQKNAVGPSSTRNFCVTARLRFIDDMNHRQNHMTTGKDMMESVNKYVPGMMMNLIFVRVP